MNHSRPKVAGATSALALVSVVGCDRSIDNPRAPDTAPLQETYDRPPGHLSSAAIAETAKDFAKRLQLMADTGNMSAVTEVLSEAEDHGLIADLSTVDASENPRRLLTVAITRVCRGDDPARQVIDPERFGTMTMQLKASEHGLFPVVWGSFEQCVQPGIDGAVTIDGDYFAAIRPASLPGEVDMLYAFSGVLTKNTQTYEGDLDFRLLADGAIEVRVHSADGDVIVGVDGAGRELARDDAGDWICQLAKLRCTNTDTQEVVTP